MGKIRVLGKELKEGEKKQSNLNLFSFKRGGQTVSRISWVLLLISWTFALVSLFVAVAKVITWLDYLYYFSYIKLGITLIKYIPQVGNKCTLIK